MTPTPEQIARYREIAWKQVASSQRETLDRETAAWEQAHIRALIANTEKLAAVRALCLEFDGTYKIVHADEILSIIDAE